MKLFPVAIAAFVLALGAAGAACGGSGDSTPAPPTTTGGDVPPTGAGGGDAAPPTYPAAHPSMPEVQNLGGATLAHPKIVPIFFPGVSYRDQVVDYASKIGASKYWSAVGTEYGVGPAEAQMAIDILDAPAAAILDDEIKAWLTSRFDGTHPEFGDTPVDGAIYTLYYPSTTTISLTAPPTVDAGADAGHHYGGGTSCRGFGGYHDDVIYDGKHISYAVIPECAKFGPLTGVDVVTGTSSHEWIEAATDPSPNWAPAYASVDDDHLAWQYVLGAGEVGDMCAQYDSSFYKDPEIGYFVQRSWSNAAAKAGSEPCVPAASTNPYFNAAPVFKDEIAVTTGDTKGVKVPVGATKSFDLVLFSSAPTSGPWDVKVSTLGNSMTPAVEFTLDKTSGVNGDVIHVMVKADTAASSRLGATPFIIESTLGGDTNYWAGLVGN
ncbi:MAG TPA: hypothetical protein VIF62_31025 [Labilithrix sp.]